jgi:serine/threonine-protein kinase
MPAAVPDTRERRLGRYTLHGEIASGGMATVHFGRLSGEGGFSRIVAIKCMHRHLAEDPEFRAMFLDEARLAARIRHPNVVSTIDIGSSDEGMFLVMEYVTGESLAALVRVATRRGERIPPSVSIRILIDTLYGLHAAHVATDDAGAPLSIVHRDVSPQNILVATDGHARVLDFGIAKAAGRSHTTRDGQLKGKFRYMAPEQIRDGPVSAQTDVYAASVVLWELLTGEPLFKGSNDAAIVARVLEGVVAAPSKLAPSLPVELDSIVLKGLAREPADRFASAEQMAEALETLSQSTTAKQVGVWVEHMAGDVLRRRVEQIARIEAAPSTPGLVVAAPGDPVTGTRTLEVELPEARTLVREVTAPRIEEPAPAGPRVRPLTVVLATALVGVFAGLAFVGARSGPGPQAPTAASAIATEAPSADTPAPPTASAPSSVPSAALAPPSAMPSTSTPTPTSPPRVRPRSGGASSPPNCSPPYYEDPSGIRRVKPQCL